MRQYYTIYYTRTGCNYYGAQINDATNWKNYCDNFPEFDLQFFLHQQTPSRADRPGFSVLKFYVAVLPGCMFQLDFDMWFYLNVRREGRKNSSSTSCFKNVTVSFNNPAELALIKDDVRRMMAGFLLFISLPIVSSSPRAYELYPAWNSHFRQNVLIEEKQLHSHLFPASVQDWYLCTRLNQPSPGFLSLIHI